MILSRATCGHYAAFAEDESLLRQVCTCPDPRFTRASVAPAELAAAGPHPFEPAGRQQPGYCDACKTVCAPGTKPGEHAPRLTASGLVDCQGTPIRREQRDG